LAAGAAALVAVGFDTPLVGAFLSDLSNFSTFSATFALGLAAGLPAGLTEGFALLFATVDLTDATGLLFEADFIESLTD
jgi:hypothetical protein